MERARQRLGQTRTRLPISFYRLVLPLGHVQALRSDSMVRRSRKAFLTKACDGDLPKSVDTFEQHFADLTGRQTYFHVDKRAVGSPQIATSRPISTIASRGSLKYSLTWTELRCIAANSASTHRGRRLSLSLGTTVSCPTK